MKKFLLQQGIIQYGLPTLTPRGIIVIMKNGAPFLIYYVLWWPVNEAGTPLRASETMVKYHYSKELSRVSLLGLP